MGNPYTTVTVTNYNSNPPADDGSEVTGNKLQWSNHKTKLGDPLKTAIESINTNVNAAIAKLVGGAGITSTATDHTVTASDQGNLIKVTASATITTPDATVVGSPFVFGVLNLHSGNITLDGSGSQTVDGVASIVIPSGFGVLLFTDGSNWSTTGQNFVTAQPVAAGYKNLIIQNNSGTPNTSIDIDADSVTVETSTGKAYRLNSINLTIDCTTTGANALDAGGLANNTWYSVWVIYNPTTDTTAGLAGTSETSPTLPSGYTAKARFGWIRTNGSAVFYRTIQRGSRAAYIVGTNPSVARSMSSGVVGTYDSASPTLTGVGVSGFIPSTAGSILVSASTSHASGTASSVLVAPSTDYGGTNRGPIGSAGQIYPIWIIAAAQTNVSAWIGLESTTLGFASSAAGGALACLGWEDNI